MKLRRCIQKLPVEAKAYQRAALCVTANLAAKCSDGSIASHPQAGGVRAMSASPPIATKHSRRSETSLCAITGCEQVQQ